MDSDMLTKPDARPVLAHLARKISQFRSDEGGAIAIFVLFIFVIMIMFGGIAVDVMRFEARRVSLQQTLDRAVLAAASSMSQKTRTPQAVTMEWFQVAGLGDEFTVDYSTPTVTGISSANKRAARPRPRYGPTTTSWAGSMFPTWKPPSSRPLPKASRKWSRSCSSSTSPARWGAPLPVPTRPRRSKPFEWLPTTS